MITRRARAALTLSVLFVAALIIGGPPAIAQPRTASDGVDLPLPHHLTWQPVERKPPLTTLLEVFWLQHVNARPKRYRGRVTVYTYKRVGLHWENVRTNLPVAVITKSDIPGPGQSVTWRFGAGQLFPAWVCKPGYYFLLLHDHGVSAAGKHESFFLYSPYEKGHQFKKTAFGRLPPPRNEAIHIRKCVS